LNGSLPPTLAWLAVRAWAGLGAVVFGAASSNSLLPAHHEKDRGRAGPCARGAGGLHWTPSIGSPLQSAIVLFSIRSLTRSRQHRVAFAFFLSIVFAIALAILRGELPDFAPAPLSPDFLMSTFMMMIFATVGLRWVFALPISLTANWVLRTTQLRSSRKYIAATRRSLLVLAVLPVWLMALGLSLRFRPIQHVAIHLAILALLGWLLVEICLIGFYKVPFTCSYLPGKANIQLIFWGFVIVMIAFVIPCAEFELSALGVPFKVVFMLCFLGAAVWALWILNGYRAESAVIYFEEIPDQVITTLGLTT
jgi:hypothetical protein